MNKPKVGLSVVTILLRILLFFWQRKVVSLEHFLLRDLSPCQLAVP